MKIGDIVTAKYGTRYTITTNGWEGRVISIHDGWVTVRGPSSEPHRTGEYTVPINIFEEKEDLFDKLYKKMTQ